MWTFFNSNIGLLLTGFVLTTAAGAVLSSWLQQRSWMRQTKLALYQKRYDEGTRFLEELSDLIGKRYFSLQRFLWSLEKDQGGGENKDAQQYAVVVFEWNTRLRTMRNKIRLLVNEQRALEFLDYRDDARGEHPVSIHYRFYHAGRAVQQAMSDQHKFGSAESLVQSLNFACSRFLEGVTTDFLVRASRLELLELPEEGVSAGNRKGEVDQSESRSG